MKNKLFAIFILFFSMNIFSFCQVENTKPKIEEAKQALREGNPKVAVELLSTLLSSDSTKAEYWNLRGNALFNLSEYEKALSDFEKAVSLDASIMSAYMNGIDASRFTRQYEKGLSLTNKLIENTRNNKGSGYYHQGLFNEALGKKEEASVSYGKALEFLPESFTEMRDECKAKIVELK